MKENDGGRGAAKCAEQKERKLKEPKLQLREENVESREKKGAGSI